MSLEGNYATALFEAARELKLSGEEMQGIETGLGVFVRLLQESRDFRLFFKAPTVSLSEKAELFLSLARDKKIHPVLAKFMELVAKRSRAKALPRISQVFSQQKFELGGGVVGDIISVEHLEKAILDRLQDVFSKKLKKPVMLREALDPTLIAGYQVKVMGVTFDATLKNQFERLRDSLIRHSVNH